MLTKDFQRALTFVAAQLRPAYAPHAEWDQQGIAANIAKVAHLDAASVALAVIRAASDPTAQTPGVISSTNSIHWRDKPAEIVPTTKPLQTCKQHGTQYREFCTSCVTDELGGDDDMPPARRLTQPTADPDKTTALLAEFRKTRRQP